MRLSALFTVLLVIGTPLWGHVVLTDGTIGVTMHIDPDDAPVTGTPSRFLFWFKDTTGRLDPARCQGTFSVALKDAMVTSQALFDLKDSGLVSVHEVTFPEPEVYTVRVSGSPTANGTSQPFRLQLSVRVEPGHSLAADLILWLGLHPRFQEEVPPMMDHCGHLLLLPVPLALVVSFRFRSFVPVAAMLLLLHHHVDPLPGSASPTQPPVCCTMAQSTEPTKTEIPVRVLMTFRPSSAESTSAKLCSISAPPAIRAPPPLFVPLPLASWTPVFRAA